MRKHLFTLLIIATSISLLLNYSCEREIERPTNNFPFLGNFTSIPPDPFDYRQNPLQTHIRDNWTNGDLNRTSGLHYDHIKIAGHNWSDIGNLDDGEYQAEFIVDHFDLYIWGGSIVGNHANGQYQNFIWLFAAQDPYIGSAWDSMVTADWLADSSKNSGGYSWEDVTMHLKYNWIDGGNNFFPGWNPDDDLNGDGCRDSAEASDSNRTAECIEDAELCEYTGSSGRPMWNLRKLMHDGNLKMIADEAIDVSNAQTYQMRGEYHDNGGMLEYSDYGIQESFTYENNDLLTANRDYYLDKLLYVSTLAKNYIEPAVDDMKLHFRNMSSPYHICEKSSPSKDWVFEYVENMRLENWLITNWSYYSYLYMTIEKREDYLNCPFENWLEEGKGIVFCIKEYSPGSNRGKLFSLATFYMINHQMAFYDYKCVNPDPQEPVSVWSWNPYVEYYIGQPTVNSLGINDFQENSGTDKYFVWEVDSNYEILGREYLRSDSLRVLVLTKIMVEDANEGDNPTTHTLPGCYQSVQPNLTLGPPIREITLCNNEGAILLATSNCVAPPEADFSADPVSGYQPLTIDFTDLSTNVPTSWEWDFGDGESSFDKNPQHTYDQKGTYTVTLTVTNCDGTDSETKIEYINVTDYNGGGSKDDPFQP